MSCSLRSMKESILKIVFPKTISSEIYENRRHEWVINRLLNIEAGKKILDAGAGEMRYRPYCEHLQYTSQDFGEYKGDEGGVGLQHNSWDTSGCDVICDIVNMPFEDNTFDVVLCTEVLEHVPQPEEALKELVRVCKRGGKIILTAPFGSLTHFAPFHFYTGFNIYWYEYIFNKYKCTIDENIRNSNYFEILCMNLLRTPGLVSRYCGVKMSLYRKLQLGAFCRYLEKIEKLDNGSSELNRGGDFIVACKE